jgi:predicted metal-dependent hydrolase
MNLIGDMSSQALRVPGLEHIPLVIAVNPRALRMRVRIDAARRRVVATTPSLRLRTKLDQFLHEQRGFIERHWHMLGAPKPFCDGAELTLFGAPLRLVHEPSRSRVMRVQDTLIIGGEAAAMSDRSRRFLRGEAKRFFEERSHALAGMAGRQVGAVRIGDAGSRWGSCSARGVLSYSWRLALAPLRVAEYVAAHEVAHLVHLNHSTAFWAENARLLGEDPLPHRRWLRREGAGLFAWGASA